MPEKGRREAGRLCWESGRLLVRSCPPAFGLLFWRGVVLPLCSSGSASEGSLMVLTSIPDAEKPAQVTLP